MAQRLKVSVRKIDAEIPAMEIREEFRVVCNVFSHPSSSLKVPAAEYRMACSQAVAVYIGGDALSKGSRNSNQQQSDG